MNFLEFLLSSDKYNIICLVETFLTVDDRDSLYLIGGKKYALLDTINSFIEEVLRYIVNLVYVL